MTTQFINAMKLWTENPTASNLETVRKSTPVDETDKSLVTILDTEFTAGGNVIHRLTFKVKTCTSRGYVTRRRGADDYTYDMHPIVGRMVQRAKSVFVINSRPILLNGLPKFGGMTLKDDDSHTGRDAPIDYSLYDSVIITNKENGKFAVARAKEIDNVIWIIAGSKNVHLAFRLDHPDDLDQYQDGLAKEICRHIRSVLKANAPALECLVNNDICFVGEWNDGMHMVPLKTTETKPYVCWFGVVDAELVVPENKQTGDAYANLILLEKLGLTVTSNNVASPSELSARGDMRYGSNLEGYVLYFIKDNETKLIAKYKTWWYIVIRAIREHMMSNYGAGLPSGWKITLSSKLVAKNRSYMEMPGPLINAWINLAIGFIGWFFKKRMSVSVLGYDDDARGMGNVWHQFIEETGTCDVFDEQELCASNNKLKPKYSGVVVFMTGIPGVGKSVVAKAVLAKLPGLEINQDELVPKFGKSAGKVCLQKMGEAMQNPEGPRLVIVSRNNSNLDQYCKYLEKANSMNWLPVFLTPEDVTHPAVIATCIQSVIDREGHETFDTLSPLERTKVVFGFAACYEEPMSDAGCIIRWKVTESLDGDYTSIVNHLNKCMRAKDGFKIQVPADFVTPQHPNRTAISDIVDYVVAKLRIIIDDIEIIDPIEVGRFLPLYFGAFINPRDKKSLTDTLDNRITEAVAADNRNKNKKNKRKKKASKPKSVINQCSHMTMVFGNHSDPIWLDIMPLSNTPVTMRLDRLYGFQLPQGLLWVASASVVDSSGKSLDHLVTSDVPHVTISTPNGVPPVRAMELLQKMKANKVKPQHVINISTNVLATLGGPN
jgi:hypothetical protein